MHNSIWFDLILPSQGEFIQTFKKVGYSYGLTMAAVEQVAQQGLACVTHMSIEVLVEGFAARNRVLICVFYNTD